MELLRKCLIFFKLDDSWEIHENPKEIHGIPCKFMNLAIEFLGKSMKKLANTMKIPMVVSEQYPKAFLHTVDTLQSSYDKSTKIFEKKKFSMVTDDCKAHLSQLGSVKSAIIVGVEAHVCVLQTSLDLIELGYDVHVLADGVSSQSPDHHKQALDRLRQSGVFVTTSESILFQLCETSEYEHFRSISKLVKEQAVALN